MGPHAGAYLHADATVMLIAEVIQRQALEERAQPPTVFAPFISSKHKHLYMNGLIDVVFFFLSCHWL